MAVVPAGSEQQAQDQSFLRRTFTANTRSQRSPLDPNSKPRIRVAPARPQLQALDRSVFQTATSAADCARPTSSADQGVSCRTLTRKNFPRYTRQNVPEDMPERMSEVRQNRCQRECQCICHKENDSCTLCQKLCQKNEWIRVRIIRVEDSS